MARPVGDKKNHLGTEIVRLRASCTTGTIIGLKVRRPRLPSDSYPRRTSGFRCASQPQGREHPRPVHLGSTLRPEQLSYYKTNQEQHRNARIALLARSSLTRRIREEFPNLRRSASIIDTPPSHAIRIHNLLQFHHLHKKKKNRTRERRMPDFRRAA